MLSLDVFLSRLAPKVLGCPDPMLRQALVDAAIEFCEETSIIQVTTDPAEVTAGVGTYVLALPTDQAASTTLKAWYKTTLLTPVPADKIDSVLAFVSDAGGETQLRGEPRLFYEINPGEIGLYPVPAETYARAFSARVAIKPTRNAVTVDDTLFNDWCEVIVAGAAARLCAMQGQAFSDPATAAIESGKFWQGVSKATNLALRGRIRGSMSVIPRAFA